MRVGNRLFGLAAVALGLVGLAWGDFALQWQPVPNEILHRAELAYAVATALVLAGAALNWRRTMAYGAALLTVLYGLGVVLLHAPRVAAHLANVGAWNGLAEQLALVASSSIAFASVAPIERDFAANISRFGRLAFGCCLPIFGLAHFSYLDFTASLVPKWLPPSQVFWAAATGVAQAAAGFAILSGIQARLASILLTVMYVIFGALVHAPAILAEPAAHLSWVTNAMNLALIGAAWIVADSLSERK